jgi:hypothetical protein
VQLNKIDSISIEELELLDRVPHYVPVSAHHGWGFDDLLEKIWEYCGMVRIYTKPRGQIPDYNAPVILHRDARTVEELCDRIHKGILKTFKRALVWGASVKHQPQTGLERDAAPARPLPGCSGTNSAFHLSVLYLSVSLMSLLQWASDTCSKTKTSASSSRDDWHDWLYF